MARRKTVMGRTTIEGTPVDGYADGSVIGSADGAESVLAGTDRTGMEDPYVGYEIDPDEQAPAQSPQKAPAKKAPAKKRKTAKQAAAAQARKEKRAELRELLKRGELPEKYIVNRHGRIVEKNRSAAQLEPDRQREGGQSWLSGLFSKLFR